MHLQKPKIRWPIDIHTQEVEGQLVIILNCPIGISKEPLVLIAGVGPLLGQFEGNKTVEEIANEFSQHGASPELVLELAKLLDTHLFLESPSFFAAEQENKKKFAESNFREPALAGFSYPSDAGILELEIDKYLALGQSVQVKSKKPLKCLVAPHIDYRRGGTAYGKAYAPLKSEKHDLYILIGTSHKYSNLTFHLCKKDFRSPLGTLKCDKEFMDELASKYGVERSYKDELLHKKEHSLELQLPFLKRQIADAIIAPILVGSFYKILSSGQKPQETEEYESFVEALCYSLDKNTSQGKSICFIAGVDMAHIGQEFGDTGNLSQKFMDKVRERDNTYIEAINTQNKDLMFEHIKEDMDARRICGFPTMYTILDVFERLGINCDSQIFDYSQAVNYDKDCAVTFSSIGMYESS